MPTYSYRCTACGHAFDAVQAFTDEALTSCPECRGRLRKLYGSVGVTFNGSGFYRTDARAAASGSTAASGGDTAASPAATPSAAPASAPTTSSTTSSE